MRIGIITGEYPPMQGGVGAYTQILAHELNRQGQEVSIFSSDQAHENTLPLTHTLRTWGLRSLPTIRQWANDQRLDGLNLQFQTAAYQMSPWIHFLPDFVRHIPIVTTFHDLRFPYLFPKAGFLRPWIVSHLAQASRGVIVTNHEDQQQLAWLKHTCLIPIGSNILSELPATYNAEDWRRRAGASETDFVLAYFGMLNRSKGIETLLESIAALRDQHAVNVRLIMIGAKTGSSDPTNQAYAAEIDQHIQALKLTDALHWTGFLPDDDVLAYLTCADVVVLPFRDGASFRRGSLMAAIHAACPIITTVPRVHIPEFVHGENMLLAPPDDPPALTQMLANYHAHQAEIGPTLRQGASQLVQHFNWQQITARYIDFFKAIL